MNLTRLLFPFLVSGITFIFIFYLLKFFFILIILGVFIGFIVFAVKFFTQLFSKTAPIQKQQKSDNNQKNKGRTFDHDEL